MTLYFKKDKLLLQDVEFANTTAEFFSTDSEEEFRRNSAKMSHDWKYHTEKIIYKWNSQGYRTKELDEIQKPFLLATGCSYTEGVGLNTKDIWASMVADNLGLELYNIGKQGNSPEILTMNALLWKANNLPKPDLVVAQWPNTMRKQFGFLEGNKIKFEDMSGTASQDGRWWKKRYIVDSGEMQKSVFQQIETFNLVWESLGVPVINFTWEKIGVPLFSEILEICPTAGNMEARDCQHDGIEFHRQTADEILASYKV